MPGGFALGRVIGAPGLQANAGASLYYRQINLNGPVQRMTRQNYVQIVVAAKQALILEQQLADSIRCDDIVDMRGIYDELGRISGELNAVLQRENNLGEARD